MEKFQNDFNAAGGRQFRLGLGVRDGFQGWQSSRSRTRPNQDTPIMDGKRALMGNDVWSTPIYLNYQNRPPTISSMVEHVNWNQDRRERYCRREGRHAGCLKFICGRRATDSRPLSPRLRGRVRVGLSHPLY